MSKVFKNTKMVCTIGPKSESKEMMGKLVDAGMNVIRCNFSHGDHAEQGARFATIREINAEKGTHVGILLDTRGPEIRTHLFENGGVNLEAGQTVAVSMAEVLGTKEKFSVNYPGLINDIEIGGTILVDDGNVELTITDIDLSAGEISCTVKNDAYVKDRRGINVPSVKLNMAFLDEKDRADIVFGCEQQVDFVAASFVRRAEDVEAIRSIFAEQGNTHTQIISKIENQEGVDNLDEIIEASDGVMVARGDMGVEVPAEEVPMIQKEIIAKCNAAGKVVITATQMLESMQENPRPTRAEVSDVANAVLDGTDAVMLSGESAAGKYPLEAVETMARIARRTEIEIDFDEMTARALSGSERNVASAVALSVTDSVADLDAKVVVAATKSGSTARTISKHRPSVPIIAATPCEKAAAALSLNWGVHPVIVEDVANGDEVVAQAEKVAAEVAGLVSGDIAVITAGLPIGEGNTNVMKIIEVK
ncbi:MAG: pyruvate kinase [Defluviitaleaceae bacterium]|nr:pyruvate kinase [Defluviitaleaceae bacterium]